MEGGHRLTLHSDAELMDVTRIDTQDGLARALRQLRRRLARRCNDAQLTYRELAAATGWAHGVIGDYFAGKTLPPTDRFDVLVTLLGATPAEQHGLATARDRVEELRRSRRASTVDSGFVDISRRVVLATLTMLDTANRPLSHVVHPLWEHHPAGLTGWVFTRSSNVRRESVTHCCHASLSYWHPTHGTAVAECEVEWADERDRRYAWLLAARTPSPAGYDPAALWPAGVDSPDCVLLRLHPWWLMSAPGRSLTQEREQLRAELGGGVEPRHVARVRQRHPADRWQGAFQ
jgi:hypothetical protein